MKDSNRPLKIHHCQTCDGYVEDVRRRCQTNGTRLTPIREQVLRLIVDNERPVKAYDLLDKLKQSQSNAAPPTVYRALDFLLDGGFVHKLESINAFINCEHLHDPHQGQFLICDVCETATELDDVPLTKRIARAAAAAGFQPARQTIEVHGLCADCADAE